MAALSQAEQNRVARLWARDNYSAITAGLTHADVLAAVSALDAAMEAAPTALPNQGQSVALNFNAVLPDPFKTTATTPQKSSLIAYWVGVKYGAIPSGGT